MTKQLSQKVLNKIWTIGVDKFLVPLLPSKYANLLQCSKVGQWNKYYLGAENTIQNQWDNTIWPLIKNFNFNVVLELAPGAGRSTERLCAVSKKIHAVEFNSYAIKQVKKRLGSSYSGCNLEYHTNNGTDLKMIQINAITAIYCWDAAVHFDKDVIKSYIKEFSRVLKVGGTGFIHHSNLGDKADKNIQKNPGWRSNMSKEIFAEACEAVGLRVVSQVDIPWGNITVDCATIFEKP